MRISGSRTYLRPTPVPKMPPGLVELMAGLSKEVLRNNPSNIYEFCAAHMRTLLEIRDGSVLDPIMSLKIKNVNSQKNKTRREGCKNRDENMRLLNNENVEGFVLPLEIHEKSINNYFTEECRNNINGKRNNNVTESMSELELTAIAVKGTKIIIEENNRILLDSKKTVGVEENILSSMKNEEVKETEILRPEMYEDIDTIIQPDKIIEPCESLSKNTDELMESDSSYEPVIQSENIIKLKESREEINEIINVTEFSKHDVQETKPVQNITIVEEGKVNVELKSITDEGKDLNYITHFIKEQASIMLETKKEPIERSISNENVIISTVHNFFNGNVKNVDTHSNNNEYSNIDSTNETNSVSNNHIEQNLDDSRSENLQDNSNSGSIIKDHVMIENKDYSNIKITPNDIESNKYLLVITPNNEEPDIESQNIQKDIRTNDSYNSDKSSAVIEKTENPDNNIKQQNIIESNKMSLETAAITIQKVFRSFLFKSRGSTFEDSANEENDSNIKVTEGYNGPFANKDRRTLAITRIDSVLQTVNEEKSLSLSTDDSSTLSSAATIIQAHVRGFFIRNKMNSSKTLSTNSLKYSESQPVVSSDTEDNKAHKTVLNIHIVPETENRSISRDESVINSMDLSLDGSPPTSINLHPLGYDKSERRKQLKREDAFQSVSPPSNNSAKLSEDIDSVREIEFNNNISTESRTYESKNNSKEDKSLNGEETATQKQGLDTQKQISVSNMDSDEMDIEKKLNNMETIAKDAVLIATTSNTQKQQQDIENQVENVTQIDLDEMEVENNLNDMNVIGVSDIIVAATLNIQNKHQDKQEHIEYVTKMDLDKVDLKNELNNVEAFAKNDGLVAVTLNTEKLERDVENQIKSVTKLESDEMEVEKNLNDMNAIGVSDILVAAKLNAQKQQQDAQEHIECVTKMGLDKMDVEIELNNMETFTKSDVLVAATSNTQKQQLIIENQTGSVTKMDSDEMDMEKNYNMETIAKDEKNLNDIRPIVKCDDLVAKTTSNQKQQQDTQRQTEGINKICSDELDVVTPFSETDAEPSSLVSDSTANLMHSGEFHDVVLPTKVIRSDTSVVRGE